MLHKNDAKMAAALFQMTCSYRGLLATRVTGTRTLIPGLVPVQFRAFSVRKEPTLEDNPYYFKYQEKIQKMCSSRPQDFKAWMEKSHESKTEILGSSKQTLGSILNLKRIQDKTCEEIAEIWTKYYATKDTISAVIPRHTYEIIATRAESCPMFLYALPQNEGYNFFVGQWSGNMLNFTSLINVQTQGENAPGQLILFHYPDLKESKGIVLMTAELDSKFLTVQQAQCLGNQVQLFYGTKREETFRGEQLAAQKSGVVKGAPRHRRAAWREGDSTYIDAIGIPRGVPDEYKLANQIAAGWESQKQKCGWDKLPALQYPKTWKLY
ncbi:ATP synthase mitochondrial F1 complex assembly factor 1 isoform X2 [Stigmatopora nigra]